MIQEATSEPLLNHRAAGDKVLLALEDQPKRSLDSHELGWWVLDALMPGNASSALCDVLKHVESSFNTLL